MAADPTDRFPLTAAVLAGGRSLRMGVDKTLLDVDGRALVARVVDAVGEVVRAHPRRHEPPRGARRGRASAGRARDLRRGRLPGSARRAGDRARRDRRRVDARGRRRHAAPRARRRPRAVGSARRRRRGRARRPRRAPSRCSRSTASRRACPSRARCSRPVGAASSAIFSRVDDGRGARRGAARRRPGAALAHQREHPGRPRSRRASSVADRLASLRAAACSSRSWRSPAGAPRARCRSRRRSPSTSTTSRSRPTQATPADLEELGGRLPLRRGAAHRPRRAALGSTSDAKRGLVWVTTRRGGPRRPRRAHALPHQRLRRGVTFASLGHARGLAPIESDLRVTRRRDLRAHRRDGARAPRCTATPAACTRAGSRADGRARDRARGRRPAQRARQGARPRVARSRAHRRRGAVLDRAHLLRDGREGRQVARAHRGLAQRRDRPGRRDRRRAVDHARRLRTRRQAHRLHAPRTRHCVRRKEE